MTTPFAWRTFTNKSGTTYTAGNTTKPYAEDMNLLGDALEEGSKSITITLREYTTTERDAIASPQTGMLIWNTTTARLEVYNGSAWGAISGSGSYPFTSSSANPSGAPSQLGAWHLNTSTFQLWVGVGTSGTTDWREVLLGGSP
jgi:hypothetical protein